MGTVSLESLNIGDFGFLVYSSIIPSVSVWCSSQVRVCLVDEIWCKVGSTVMVVSLNVDRESTNLDQVLQRKFGSCEPSVSFLFELLCLTEVFVHLPIWCLYLIA